MKREIVFDRQDTKAIKGIAVLMMLMLHLVCTPDRYPVGFEGFTSFIPGLVESVYFQKLLYETFLCVPFFFFLGGYGLWIRINRGGFSMKDTLLKLYQSYWKVFFLFVPIGLIFFSREIENASPYTSRFSSMGILDMIIAIISDFTGLTCRLNGEWWFFGDYLCILVLGYLFCRFLHKSHTLWEEMLIVFGIDMFIRSIVPQIPSITLFSEIDDNFLYSYFMNFSSYAPCFFAGCVIAKHDGICQIKQMLAVLPFRTLLSIIGIAALILLRSFVVGPNIDLILCPLLISMCSLVLDSIKPAKKLFAFFGKHSTNMWLNHSFFCFYFFEFTLLVYATCSITVNFIILVLLSVVASILTDFFYLRLGKAMNRFRANIQ